MNAKSVDDNVIWVPAADARERSAMGRFFAIVGAAEGSRIPHPFSAPAANAPYAEWHRWSCDHPDAFWTSVLALCGSGENWTLGPSEEVLVRGDVMAPPGPKGPQWFPAVRLNFAEQLLHHWQSGDVAIIARSEGGARRVITGNELIRDAGCFAAELRASGVKEGDVVAGFMPNIPEAVVAMLATTWIGATWTSCSPDFGAQGVLDRFGQVKPKVLVCADGYRYAGKEIDSLPRIAEIVSAIPSIERVVVVPFLRTALKAPDLASIRNAVPLNDWIGGRAAPEFVRSPFDHPLYIMYSSGTTGLPKCMVHGAGGTLLQHLKEHQLHCDIGPGDRVFYFTTCGWMMWNWLVSVLASSAALVLYDGAPMPPSEPGSLWRMADEEEITVFGTSAKYIAGCESAGVAPVLSHRLSRLRLILSTGSPLAPHGFDYVMRDVKPTVQLSSISGGTDLLGCFVGGNPLLPVRRGEIQCAALGMDVDVVDENGKSVTGEPGELVCRRPFPSMPVAFWDDPDGAKYRAAYFDHTPGVWRHGDWVERTAHGGFIVHGRSDATLNPGGVRIGTAEIYREVEQVDGVVESVVIGQEMGDAETRIVLFVRLAPGVQLDDALRARIRARLRDHASPHHVPKVIAQVTDIPRTISGKITELAVREVVHGRPVRNTEALANPGALEEFRDRVELRV
jgi:acetoacetyl-CoA synthetase